MILINTLRARGVEVEIHWIPAHIDISGNEAADVAVKQATGWRQKRVSRGNKIIEYDINRSSKKAAYIKSLRSALKTVIAKDTHQQ